MLEPIIFFKMVKAFNTLADELLAGSNPQLAAQLMGVAADGDAAAVLEATRTALANAAGRCKTASCSCATRKP